MKRVLSQILNVLITKGGARDLSGALMRTAEGPQLHLWAL